MDEANRMVAEGVNVLKLNIGNPAPHGLMAPDEVVRDMAYNLRDTEDIRIQRDFFCKKGDHAVLPAEEYSKCRNR